MKNNKTWMCAMLMFVTACGADPVDQSSDADAGTGTVDAAQATSGALRVQLRFENSVDCQAAGAAVVDITVQNELVADTVECDTDTYYVLSDVDFGAHVVGVVAWDLNLWEGSAVFQHATDGNEVIVELSQVPNP